MQRIYSYATVPSDIDELIINGILNTEFRRQGELYKNQLDNAIKKYEQERDFSHMRKNMNYDALKEKYDKLRASEAQRCNRNFRHKAKEKLIFVWGCTYYYAQTIMSKLIVYEGE